MLESFFKVTPDSPQIQRSCYLNDKLLGDTARAPISPCNCEDTDQRRTAGRSAPCPHSAHLQNISDSSAVKLPPLERRYVESINVKKTKSNLDDLRISSLVRKQIANHFHYTVHYFFLDSVLHTSLQKNDGFVGL